MNSLSFEIIKIHINSANKKLNLSVRNIGSQKTVSNSQAMKKAIVSQRIVNCNLINHPNFEEKNYVKYHQKRKQFTNLTGGTAITFLNCEENASKSM